MNKDEVIQKLEVFNKHADELFKSKFVQEIRNAKVTISMKKGEPVEVIDTNPGEEAIKAFILDIRKFFQKNDSLKIHKLQPIYQSDLVDAEEKEIYNKVMKDLDAFHKQIVINMNGKNITFGELLEVFLYGKYAHRNESLSKTHDEWEDFKPVYGMLKFDFITGLTEYMRFVNNIVFANRVILKKLKDNPA